MSDEGRGRSAVGIDIGGTKLAGALVDEDGRISHRDQAPTPDDTEGILEAIAALATTLLEAADGPVAGIGLACAGLVDGRTGHLWFAPNLPWREVAVAERVGELVGREVVVENDASAAAWGEYRHGTGHDHDDMVLITVGTGVGGGCIADDRLLRGAFGIGGEIGHVVLDPNGPRCGCGNHGCLEAFASGTALMRNARELVASPSPHAQGLLERCGGDPERLTGTDITDAAREGDQAAVELLAELGGHLGEGIASVCAVLDPGLVVIGGGVADAGDLLLEPALAALGRRLVGRGHRPSPELALATLGNDAGIVGAATLARERAQ